ncbi:stage V sporulation protein AA [Ruminococcus sp. AF17-22AC]|jgi:stage V sporulation protein AA|uniref:stage V sporulation protein AA n=1 Tax=Clostridia TaxID=186801 RepID=UPI0009305F6A|nr:MULTISPECIES: stage V sporulation protein AA [Clostridia]RGU31851.1 stage V sporulation protein AA [Ruminococcus sp. AF17-22AC]RHO76758.1 stage V sporulation protein AA [Ruminococcus sp. AF45-4BH]
MSDTLYIQTDMNILIKHPHVYLQDIARLSCSNSKVLNRLRVLPVANLNPDTPGRYTMSVMDLVDLIQKKEPDLDITPLGELSFILTYQPPGKPQMIFEILKVVFISLASFFGAAFSIMTFNTDADVGTLFKQIYQQVTGNVSNGFTILEISYSIGLAAGVLFFFNHFGRKKFSADPTPMQVQMRQYEDNVNTTLLEESSRKASSS